MFAVIVMRGSLNWMNSFDEHTIPT